MRSCLLLLITMVIVTALLGGAGALYYLSKTSKITRVENR